MRDYPQSTYDAGSLMGGRAEYDGPSLVEVPALSRIGDRIGRATALAGEVGSTLGVLGDRLFGSQPEPGRKGDGARQGGPASQIAGLEEMLDELEWRLSVLNERSHRLNGRL